MTLATGGSMTDHITIPRALLEQALEAFQHITTDGTGKSGKQIVQDICAVEVAIRAELAKPEEQAEPVAWLYSVPGYRSAASCERIPLDMTPRETTEAPLYLHPPTPAWHDAPETLALKAERDAQLAIYDKAIDNLQSQVNELVAALKGVIRVADRKTDEFDAARAAIAKTEGRKE